MIRIKVNMKILVLSILITALMYPKTIEFLINNGKNIYIARKLSTSTIQRNTTVDADKTKIVFIFDDGWKSVFTEAYGVMNKYDYRASVSIIPTKVYEKEYMSYEELSELYLNGWDLLNHSYSHEEDAYDNPDELLSEFNRARRWMENRHFGNCSGMLIIPYGDINPYLIKQIKDAKFSNIRTSDNILILDKYEIEYYSVNTINLLTDVTVKEVEDRLTQTSSESNAILFILHKIGNEDDEFGMTYSKDKFEQIIMYINQHSDKFQVISYSQLFE